MSQRDLILDYANRWRSIGIDSVLIKVEGEHRSKKLYRKTVKVDEEILKSPDMLSDDFNFLGISLKSSGIFCLDVEGIGESVDNFYAVLDERGIDPDSFLMEKSLNGGIHAYFRVGELEIKNEHFKFLHGIHFDVLTKFRAFTSPSKFRNKKYEWIGDSFYRLTSLDQIPKFPKELYDFIEDI